MNTTFSISTYKLLSWHLKEEEQYGLFNLLIIYRKLRILENEKIIFKVAFKEEEKEEMKILVSNKFIIKCYHLRFIKR